MNGNRKGGSFEREICKRLSLWWSLGVEGTARDDIFWRASQSGGRATQRQKQGKATFGSYGDIAAVDPVGLPLLKVFTFELKRGRSHGNIGDLVDLDPNRSSRSLRPFEETVLQAYQAHHYAKSREWAIISQRDRRDCMIYMRVRTLKALLNVRNVPWVYVNIFWQGARYVERCGFCRFESFLRRVTPDQIVKGVG